MIFDMLMRLKSVVYLPGDFVCKKVGLWSDALTLLSQLYPKLSLNHLHMVHSPSVNRTSNCTCVPSL
jgi:hypothetical protein